MASSSSPILLFHCLLLLSATLSAARKTAFRPRALVLPVTKHPSTLQHFTTIKQRTPLVPVPLTLDLGGRFLWVDCADPAYASSSYSPARCRSATCNLARPKGCGKCYSPRRPGCNNNTCIVFPENTVTRTIPGGELATELLSIQSTDGANPGPVASAPKVALGCGATFLLQGLARGVKGMAALGRTKIALPSQLAAAFGFPLKFAICLSSAPRSKGVVFFGDSPYIFLPNIIDASQSLIYTPLLVNPVSTASASFIVEPSAEYFIGVQSIRVNGKPVPLNASLLSIDSDGNGGTKISTVNPYTAMETSIYNAVAAAFAEELGNATRAAAVGQFEYCFSSKGIRSTPAGPAVPTVDLVLQSHSVSWSIFGANSMVDVGSGVLCLGIVDGGENPRTSIVIGGHQLEDNLLQFDLAANRLGFTSSLLFQRTACTKFNFTSVARF